MLENRENNQHVITIPLDVKFDDQFIEDTLITCFEGGSNYWIHHIETIRNPNGNEKPKDVHSITWMADAIKCGGYIVIDHTDYLNGWKKGDNIELVTLDMNKFINGLKLYIEDHMERSKTRKV